MFNGTEVEGSKVSLRNQETPSLGGVRRQTGDNGDGAAEPSVQGLQRHSGSPRVTPGTIGSPCRMEHRISRTRFSLKGTGSTGRDQSGSGVVS